MPYGRHKRHEGCVQFGLQRLLGVRTMTDIAAEIRDILVFHLGVEEARLTDGTRLEDLGADSLDLVEIVMSCEEKFDIEIPNPVATRFTTVGDAVRFVEAELAMRASAAAEQARPVGLLFGLR